MGKYKYDGVAEMVTNMQNHRKSKQYYKTKFELILDNANKRSMVMVHEHIAVDETG